MRSSFLKNPRDLQDEELDRYERVKELAKKMTSVMKHIAGSSRLNAAPIILGPQTHSVGGYITNFTGPEMSYQKDSNFDRIPA